MRWTSRVLTHAPNTFVLGFTVYGKKLILSWIQEAWNSDCPAENRRIQVLYRCVGCRVSASDKWLECTELGQSTGAIDTLLVTSEQVAVNRGSICLAAYTTKLWSGLMKGGSLFVCDTEQASFLFWSPQDIKPEQIRRRRICLRKKVQTKKKRAVHPHKRVIFIHCL